MNSQEQTKLMRRAIELILSMRKEPNMTEVEFDEKLAQTFTKEELAELENLLTDVSTKGLRERGRKKGVVTPRQTVRIDEADWKAFQRKCHGEGSSASEEIRQFIKRKISG